MSTSPPHPQSDPEHLASCESLLNHTIAIVSKDRDEGGKVALGSGVLIDVKGRLFVATAQHCIDMEPVIMMDGMELPPDGYTAPQPRIRILNRGGDEKLDIGFLELETGKRIQTKAMHCPCSLDQLFVGKIAHGSPIHVVGWPQYSWEREGRNLLHTLEAIIGLSDSTDERNLYYSFGVTAQQWEESRQEWRRKGTPSPVGFSGGGVWGVRKVEKGEVFAPSKANRLIAIQARWTKPDRRCRAPLIANWVRLVAESNHDLEDVLFPILNHPNPGTISRQDP